MVEIVVISILSQMRNSIPFRAWWRKPKKTIDLVLDRRVTFLELFYDLVYVVIIAELTHSLATNITMEGLLSFGFLFVLVWWAWFNGTMYHELHGNNDIRTRVFTFLQMMSVAGMAIFAHNAFSDGALGFALSYLFYIAILTYLWWRTGVHDAAHKPLSDITVQSFIFAGALVAFSLFLPSPHFIYAWIGSLLIVIIAPLQTANIVQKNPEVREEYERTLYVRPSLIERFGLFSIIVLGEVIISVVQGVAGIKKPGLELIVLAALGLGVAIGMWWLYFDFISHKKPTDQNRSRFSWLFLHLPLTASIAMTGASILKIIETHQQMLALDIQLLLTSSVALFFISVALLVRTLDIEENQQRFFAFSSKLITLSAPLVALLGLLQLSSAVLLLLINIIILALMLSAFKLWTRKTSAVQPNLFGTYSLRAKILEHFKN